MSRWIVTMTDGREQDAQDVFGGVPDGVREVRLACQPSRRELRDRILLLARRDFAAMHLHDREVLALVDPHRIRAWARDHGAEQVTTRLDARGRPLWETIKWVGSDPVQICVGGPSYDDWGARVGDNLKALSARSGIPAYHILAEVLAPDLHGDPLVAGLGTGQVV